MQCIDLIHFHLLSHWDSPTHLPPDFMFSFLLVIITNSSYSQFVPTCDFVTLLWGHGSPVTDDTFKEA